MTERAEISITNAHGTFSPAAYAVDLMISKHLPASVNDLRKALHELNPALDYSDINYVSEALIMLADTR